MIALPLFSQNVFLELNLTQSYQFGLLAPPRSKPYLGVLAAIDRATRDNNIRGIVLNLSGFNSSRENLWELRAALERFRAAGKKVVAFVSHADLDLYTLATVADKIVMDGQGSLQLLGYVWGRSFFQHSLERLGIGVRELRYFEYKSAAETFTRDTLSEADIRQYGEYLDDIFSYTRATLMAARSWTAEDFDEIINRDFLFSAQSALQRGVVDRIGRKDAIVDALKELGADKVKNFVLHGDPATSVMQTRSAYRTRARIALFARPPAIAVVYATGATDMELGIAARSLARTVRELAERRRVKAIVLRINSPGGSAEAADYLAEAVRFARQKKPVVVSMGRAAASGGYWAAVHANHIVATPFTLTGSIGVIGSWFFDDGATGRLGVTQGLMQRGDSADLLTGFLLPNRDLRDDEEERFQNMILDMYRVFIEKVAEGRSMEIEAVEAVAAGRVFSGQRALEAGLVDSIGGLWDAIDIARNLAGIPPGKRIILSEYPRPSFRDRVLRQLAFAAASVAGSFGGAGTGGLAAAAALEHFLLPAPMLEDLRFRLERNGQPMPILPLGMHSL
ncbi:MAG: signal peptide peptidase SppA [Spirochaetes bacterium]|nr:signal peptide peptidase SppA [Spirochaetota bacterium]